MQAEASKTGTQPDGTFAVETPRKPAGQAQTAAPAWAQTLIAQTNTLVDIYAETLQHASRHGIAVKPEDVRSLLVTSFIQLSQKGAAMQPNGKVTAKTVQSFEEFTSARAAKETAELAELAQLAEQAETGKPARKRKAPKPPVEVKEASLADLLLQAITIVNNRTGRRPQAERIREEVLFDVLQAAIRGK